MKTQLVPIESLTLDPKNARKHPDRNLDAVKSSLESFGQQKPIVVTEEGLVIAGNGTLEAARALGWKKIAVVRTKLDEMKAAAYALADNRTSELAEWDWGVLGDTMRELQELDVDLGSLGWSEDEIENLLAAEFLPPEIDEAELETPGDKPTKLEFTAEQIQAVLEALGIDEVTDAELPALIVGALAG